MIVIVQKSVLSVQPKKRFLEKFCLLVYLFLALTSKPLKLICTKHVHIGKRNYDEKFERQPLFQPKNYINQFRFL